MADPSTLGAPPHPAGPAPRERSRNDHTADRDVRRARRIVRALHAGGVGVWEVDVPRDRVSIDRRGFEILGIEPHEFDGSMHGWLRLVEPDDLIATRVALADAMAGRRPLDHHFRIRRPDRAIRHLRICGQTDRDESGRALRMCGIVLDVTRAIVASASSASAESVEQSRRLHNEMLLRMGHDLRSPLNAMMGFAQLIERHPSELPDPVRQHARHIADAGSRLLGLLADLLDLSRIGVAPPASAGEGFNAAQALRHCADAFAEPCHQRGIDIEARIEPDLPVRGSAESLVQAVHRLLHHCLARSPRGSRILLRAQRMASPSGAGVRIEISDGGPALGEAERMQLFTPFSPSARLGTTRGSQDEGLGLAIAHALVERMGGSLVAPDPVRTGVFLRIDLLAHEAVPASASAGPAPDRAPRANGSSVAMGRTRVLYIEDNRLNVAVLESLFARTPGYDFRSAPDGPSGLEAAERDPPDVVLLDLDLPGLPGDEVMRRLHRLPRLASVPCIAVSANALPDEMARYRAMGFVDYVTKPFDLRVLLATVARHALRHEPPSLEAPPGKQPGAIGSCTALRLDAAMR